MRVAIIHDAVYACEDVKWYCNQIDYNLIKSFLEYFDDVSVIARKGQKKSDFVELDFQNVSVRTLPAITRPVAFVKGYLKTKRIIKQCVMESDAVYCRNTNGITAQKIAKKHNIHHVTFIGGCIYESMMAMNSPYMKIMAGISYHILKKSILRSEAVMYCSPHLQQKYPTNGESFIWTEVNINQASDDIVEKRRARIASDNKEVCIGLIGQYNNDIKGVDIAIKAISPLGKNVKLKILGSGDGERLKNLAKKYNDEDRIEFCGVLSGGNAVFEWLDNIDIYIQPSRTEGLPKATLEAMSRGCPVITSSAGGLPVVTKKEYVHEIDDDKALSEMLKALTDDKSKLSELSEYSFERIGCFSKKHMNSIFDSVCKLLLGKA